MPIATPPRRWFSLSCGAGAWKLVDDLKGTLQMEMLRSRTPEMLQKRGVRGSFIAHNLLRCTMAQAASRHRVCLERISFKGTLDALRQFTQAMSQARTQKQRSQL